MRQSPALPTGMLLLVVFVFAACSEPVITPVRDEVLFRQQRFPDLVFVNFNQEDVVHLGSFDGLGPANPVEPNALPSVAGAAGDTNGDGFDELLIGSGSAPLEHRLYSAAGDGTFQLLTNNSVATASTAATIADLDNDGDLDYVIGGQTSLFVYLNPGNGTLSGGADIDGGNIDPTTAFVVADMTGNGFSDVLLLGEESGGPPSDAGAFLAVNNSSGVSPGSFAPPTSIFLTSSLDDIVALDYNSDGDEDFVIASGGSPVNLIRGTGGGAFDTVAATTSIENAPDPAMSERAVAAGDVNNDGHTDLVFGTDTINRVYLGNGVDGNFT